MVTESSYFRIAKKESAKSTHKMKMGCVIVSGSNIIGRGFNIHKTHTKFGSGNGNTIHAEGMALIDAYSKSFDLSKCEAYIYRQGNLMARPCKHCLEYLKFAGIRKVYYTCEEDIVEEKI